MPDHQPISEPMVTVPGVGPRWPKDPMMKRIVRTVVRPVYPIDFGEDDETAIPPGKVLVDEAFVAKVRELIAADAQADYRDDYRPVVKLIEDLAALDRLIAWKGPHRHREFGVRHGTSGWLVYLNDRGVTTFGGCDGKSLAAEIESVLRTWEAKERKKEDYQV